MHAVGVDIGGTKIAAGVVDDEGRILAKTRRKTSPDDVASIDRAIAEVYAEFARDYDVTAVGVAAAGFVSTDRNTVLFAPNIAWREHAIGDAVRAIVGQDVRVVVENDANAAGWAEFRFGAGRDAQDMLLLTIGTGLGGAVVTEGRLQRGRWGFAAEVGHVRVVPDGHRCGCGHNGCWEQYASGSALVREARTAATADPERAAGLLARSGGDPEAISGPDVTAAAAAGDELARALVAQLGRWIGEGSASIAAVLDPEIVVVGGGVADAGELLFPSVRDGFLRELSARGHRPEAEIVAARLGNDAGIVGAADLARVD